MGQALAEGAGVRDKSEEKSATAGSGDDGPVGGKDDKGAAVYSRGKRRWSTLEIGKEDMKFSAAHYTVFSATERERLHGHTHAVRVQFTGEGGG